MEYVQITYSYDLNGNYNAGERVCGLYNMFKICTMTNN